MSIVIKNVRDGVDVALTSDGTQFMSTTEGVAWIGSVDRLVPSGFLSCYDPVQQENVCLVVVNGQASVHGFDPNTGVVFDRKVGYMSSPFHVVLDVKSGAYES